MKSLQLILIVFSILFNAQQKNKALVLGTFHFHITPHQVGVNYNINDTEKQRELEKIAKQIAKFKPTKIFVEETDQNILDDTYQLYLSDNSFNLIKEKYGKFETKYFESEIQQLGFRVAKLLNHKNLYAFDYKLDEDLNNTFSAIEKTKQSKLMEEIQKDFSDYGKMISNKFETENITNILLFLNSSQMENRIKNTYISYFNRAGELEDFSGAELVANRNKRNLFMYSKIQKQINDTDERILIIAGASHTADLKELILADKKIEIESLKKFLR